MYRKAPATYKASGIVYDVKLYEDGNANILIWNDLVSSQGEDGFNIPIYRSALEF